MIAFFLVWTFSEQLVSRNSSRIAWRRTMGTNEGPSDRAEHESDRDTLVEQYAARAAGKMVRMMMFAALAWLWCGFWLEYYARH